MEEEGKEEEKGRWRRRLWCREGRWPTGKQCLLAVRTPCPAAPSRHRLPLSLLGFSSEPLSVTSLPLLQGPQSYGIRAHPHDPVLHQSSLQRPPSPNRVPSGRSGDGSFFIRVWGHRIHPLQGVQGTDMGSCMRSRPPLVDSRGSFKCEHRYVGQELRWENHMGQRPHVGV